jgi:hypothetical protein
MRPRAEVEHSLQMPPSKRNNLYTWNPIGQIPKGVAYIYKIPYRVEKYSAYMNFPNGYKKRSTWYSVEDGQEWIDCNYQRLWDLVSRIPEPDLDPMGKKHYRLPPYIN